MIVSKSAGEAKKTVSLIRSWLEYVPFLKHLSPTSRSETHLQARDTTMYFDVGPAKEDRTPSLEAVGVDGQIEGKRAHRVAADDAETDTNTQTFEARERLSERVTEFAQVASYGNRDIEYVGTYHHEESLYLKLDQRGYVFRTWPLLVPNPKQKVLNLAPGVSQRIDAGALKVGDNVFGHRLDGQYVAEKQGEGQRSFSMQQMLICDLGDTLRYPLQLRDLIVFPVQRDKAPIGIAWGLTNDRGGSTRLEDIQSLGFGKDGLYAPIMYDADWSHYTGVKMWIDPSGRGADKTGYAVVAHLHGYLWCMDVGGLDGGFDQHVLNRLAEIARRWRVNDIFVEDNFGQGMFQPLFEPVLLRHFAAAGDDDDLPQGWGASVETIRVKGQKELRIIESLEPVMNQHRLIISPDVAANKDFQHQLTRITRQRDSLAHDDELESLANCVAQWSYVLHQDPAVAAERQRKRWMQDELNDFRRLAGVGPKETARWFTRTG